MTHHPADVRYLAHAFGQRYDLPIPLTLFVVGGAAVVVVSFLLVFRRPVTPAVDQYPDRGPIGQPHPVRAILSVLVLLGFIVVGLTGNQAVADNILPTTFWITLWIVVPLTCGLVGNWTPTVNPFAALSRLGDRAGLRKTVLARSRPLEWTFGWWPATALFVLLVLGELVFNLTATVPAFIASALLVYGLLCATAGMLFGTPWQQQGEVFSVLFDVWGRQGYWRHGSPGRRGFGGGLDLPFEASLSRVVFVLLMLVNINFDGLSATQRWKDFERATVGQASSGVEGLKTASLLLLIALALGLFGVFAVAAARAGRHQTRLLTSLAGLLPSLIPIAFGYLIAHYCSYVLTNLQLYGPLIGNPGYSNWPLHLPHPFNSSSQVDLKLLPPSFYWYLSLAAIVLAHVAAVIIAHRHISRRALDDRSARSSEYPWLAAMVLYTMFSLFLIGQSETKDASTGATAAAAGKSRDQLMTPIPTLPVRDSRGPEGLVLAP